MLTIRPKQYTYSQNQSNKDAGQGRKHKKACGGKQKAALKKRQRARHMPDDPSGQKEYAHSGEGKTEHDGQSGSV
jgi:hypothetical protein